MKKIIVALIVGGLFLPLAPLLRTSLRAETTLEDSDAFRDIAKDLRCPTCTGISVLESDATFSSQIKAQVKEQMAQGKSKDAILAFFVERYGPWILREPPKAGFHILAWAVPIAILCLGPLLVWFFVWRHRVVMDNYGVRPAETIISEMEQELNALRKRRS